jgi:Ca2+-binding RTX toxin-like protein
VYGYDRSDDPDDSGPVDLSSTIIANNTADFGPDLGQGEFADGFVAGFSLIESPADAVIAEARSARANIIGVDPELGPLADNGGPTQTHLPGTRSPVVDAGIANGLTTDQRGLARTADLDSESNAAGSDATDIGSVEIQVADCQGRSAVRQDGTDGDDRLDGTDGSDVISGLAGNDVIKGLGFRDCLFGDEDKDTIKGGGGRDEARGEAGKDKVNGQAGKDKLKGDGGRDNVNGGSGKDRVTGGKGKDRVRGGPGKDRLKGGKGKDKLLAKGGQKDRVNCGAGDGDKAIVSENDKVSRNCEKVVVRGG